MKKVGNWFAATWYPVVLFIAATLLIAFFLWFQLGSLVPGFSDAELKQRATSSTYQALMDNPLNAPHKALQLTAQFLKQTSPFAMRSASAIIGLIIVGCFYYILRNWYSRRVAVLGTFLFASSAWFLHVARSGTDVVMYALLIATVACVIWLQNSKGSILAVLFSALFVLTMLYTPGMIWFIIPIVFWQIRRIGHLLEGQNVSVLTILTLLVAVALAPIGWALYQHPELVKTYFGLPQYFPEWKEIIKNIAEVPLQLFVRGPDNPETWLGRIPLLGWFSTAMFVIGTYAYFFKRKLDRTWFIVYVLVVGTIFAGLGGPVNISILMPFIYLMVAGGMALMLQQWFTVFPHNPVAKTLGAVLMTIAVLVTSYFHISHYYIAWPNSPETKEVYNKTQ
jgi:hypothetical protein